jgi:small subunit ribosomal protein S12
MPTFNQLVRKGREKSEYKSKAPAMQKGLNTLKNRETDLSAPQKRGVCAPRSGHPPPRSPTQPPQGRPRPPDERLRGDSLHPRIGHNLQEHSIVMIKAAA